MQRYIEGLEAWLNKWRLSIAPNKCSYTIYCGKVPILFKNSLGTLKIFSENIPVDHNPKYLGVKLDRKLSFAHHKGIVRQKCLKMQNVLKCLAYKNWALDKKQQIVIYKTLIRSCMEYVPTVVLESENNVKLLQGVQYQALRIILKEPLRASSTEMHTKANLETISTRLNKLNDNYWDKCRRNGNELIEKLCVEEGINHGKKA